MWFYFVSFSSIHSLSWKCSLTCFLHILCNVSLWCVEMVALLSGNGDVLYTAMSLEFSSEILKSFTSQVAEWINKAINSKAYRSHLFVIFYKRIMTLQWWIGVVCIGLRNFPLDVTFVELLHKSWQSDILKSSCRHSYYNLEQWPVVSPSLFYIVQLQLRDWFTTVTHDRFLSVCLMINEHLLRRFWDVIYTIKQALMSKG